MSKKIVIVGALGYLGSELCKLYSGESWFHNIVAIDNRFVSKRVNQLKDWNIKFYQGQILDKNFCRPMIFSKHSQKITTFLDIKRELSPFFENHNISCIS